MGYIPWGMTPLGLCPPSQPQGTNHGLRPPAKSLRGANTGPRAALVSELRNPPVGPDSPRDEIVRWIRELRILRRCYRDDPEAVGWIDEAVEETVKWIGRLGHPE